MQHKGKVIVVDNYDSFTYNLSQVVRASLRAGARKAGLQPFNFHFALQYLGSLGCSHAVLKNDELSVDELRELEPKGILISPGPGEHENEQEIKTRLARRQVGMAFKCIN